MRVEIKRWADNAVIYTAEVPDDTPKDRRMRLAVLCRRQAERARG